jgi:hypothetical protein
MRQWSSKSEFCVATGNMKRRYKKPLYFNHLENLPKFYANVYDRQDRPIVNPLGQCFPQGYPPFWWIFSCASKKRLFDEFLRKMTDL